VDLLRPDVLLAQARTGPSTSRKAGPLQAGGLQAAARYGEYDALLGFGAIVVPGGPFCFGRPGAGEPLSLVGPVTGVVLFMAAAAFSLKSYVSGHAGRGVAIQLGAMALGLAAITAASLAAAPAGRAAPDTAPTAARPKAPLLTPKGLGPLGPRTQDAQAHPRKRVGGYETVPLIIGLVLSLAPRIWSGSRTGKPRSSCVEGSRPIKRDAWMRRRPPDAGHEGTRGQTPPSLHRALD